MESSEKRKARLEDGSPIEIIVTLLNSIDNRFNRQIDVAAQAGAWELVFIGIHSVATTIGTGLFDDSPLTGFTRFLQAFVDTNELGYNFSEIAKELHDWRHVLVHRLLSAKGYEFGFDMEQLEGWRRSEGITWINPRRFHEAFNGAFAVDGRVWLWKDLLSDEEQQASKRRLLANYHK